MQVQPVKFNGSGLVGQAAYTAPTNSTLSGKPFAPAYGGSASVDVPAQPQRFVGFAYTGFTKVIAYNGTDNTGDVVFVGGGAGTYDFSHEINCNKGLFVEVTGAGSGTVWLA